MKTRGARAALAALCVVACSSTERAAGDETFPAEPLVSLESEVAHLHIDVRTSPEQPPTRGVLSVELTIEDPLGTPLDGLTIEVVPWMPAMAHGASVQPSVTPRGGGRYVLRDVDLFMPGQWELRTAISGSYTDHATAKLYIP
jgi:hypothetical protein